MYKNEKQEKEKHKYCTNCDQSNLGLIASAGASAEYESLIKALPEIQKVINKQWASVEKMAGFADED